MTAGSDREARFNGLLPLIVTGFVGAVAIWAGAEYAVGVFHDDGVYAILAKSLASGEGYRYLHIPGAPLATHYPPGYPLLLAGLWKVAPDFPRNIGVFLIANALMLAVTAWSTVTFARRVLGWSVRAAAAAAVVATLSYPLLMLSGLVLSEPMFAAMLLPSLIAAERLALDDTRPGWKAALPVGVAAGLLTLVRTHAVALVMAIVLILAVRKRWRSAALCGAAALAVMAPWQLWVAAHDAVLVEGLRGSYGSYASWLADGTRSGGGEFIGATLIANVRGILTLFADRFSVSDHAIPRSSSALVAAVLIAIGGWRAARRAPVTVAFAALYLAILLVWPYTPWRFVFAVWPLAVLFLGETVRWAVELRVRRTAPAILVLTSLAILAVGALRQEARAYSSQTWHAPARFAAAQIAPVVRWILRGTSEDDLVAVDGEQLVFLFTGRRAVPIVPFTAREYVHPRSVAANAASLKQLLADLPVGYVLTIQPGLRASADMLARSSDTAGTTGTRLVPIDPLPGGGVFRVDRRDSLPTQQ